MTPPAAPSVADLREMVDVVYSHPWLRVGLLSLAGLWLLKTLVLALWRRLKVNQTIKARLEMAEQRKKEVRRQCAEVTSGRSIVDQPVHTLIDGMKSGRLKVVDVLHAFQREALDLNDQINCVTDAVPEAEALAKKMDANPEKEGLLYGLPISVKEHIALAGYDYTGGVSQYLNRVSWEDAEFVKILKRHGAIPFMRGNLPQTMMSYSCENPIYGCTVNPHDKTRTPGGSSGGDAAIIGGGACLLSIGSDIGGSLRVPANHCGIYSLKPTVGRMCSNFNGVMMPVRGIGLQGVLGPMARDMETLVLASRVLMSPTLFEVDPTLAPLPFNEQLLTNTSRLRIGYYTDDGTVQCLPPSARAVHEAKAALEKLGHEVVHFDFPTLMGRGFPNMECFLAPLISDRIKFTREILKHDKYQPGLRLLSLIVGLPAWSNKILGSLISLVEPVLGNFVKCCAGKSSVYDYQAALDHYQKWQAEFLTTWRNERLDAVICPVWPSPVPTTEQAENVTAAGTYTQMYNSLNYPAGVVPVSKVNEEDVRMTFDPATFKPSSLFIRELMKCAKNSEGLPIGVQCVALPFREEICLRVMGELDKALRSSHPTA